MANGKTAFVTGGSGFIGGALIRRLVSDGWKVRGLARSPGSEQRVMSAGGEPVAGDLDNERSIREAAEGADVTFHAAAAVLEWGAREEFEKGNVTGTKNVLEASREARVDRFVHVGTEAALLVGQPLINVDETAPLRPDSKAYYPATKAEAEQAVRDANRTGEFETVVVRPRLVWGVGDTTILPAITEMVKKGRFVWIGGGKHLTSTAHVDNVVEGLVLGAQKGKPGEPYFVTDGDPVVFREFMTELMATNGVEAPTRSAPAGLTNFMAAASEGIWRTFRLKGTPPVTRMAAWAAGLETTIDISKARAELGYEPVKTIEEGMQELREANAAS